MAVLKTPDGRWYVQWRDGEKKPKRYFGHGDLAEAQARRFDEEQKREKGKLNVTSITVGQLCDLYEAGHPVEESTAKNNDYKYRILKANLGSLPAESLTSKHLNEYVTARLKAGKKRATIVRELGLLKAVYSWAEDQDPPLVIRNTIRKFKMPKQTDSEIPAPPSAEEVELLLDAAEPHLLRAILLLYYTGIRPGPKEAFRLRWSDIDLVGKSVRVISARKGGPSVRKIPLKAELLEEMKKWAEEDKKAFERYRDLTVIHYKGKPVESLKTAWSTAKERAGITRELRPYDLRHANITALLEAGADLKATSELAGHSRPDTTVRVYQHVSKRQHRAAIDLMPAVRVPEQAGDSGDTRGTRKGRA